MSEGNEVKCVGSTMVTLEWQKKKKAESASVARKKGNAVIMAQAMQCNEKHNWWTRKGQNKA